jgi:hypothetical protein
MQSVQNSLLQNTALPLTMKEFAKTHFANMVISAKVAKGIMQKITVKNNPVFPSFSLRNDTRRGSSKIFKRWSFQQCNSLDC